jgi:hypothetical protein
MTANCVQLDGDETLNWVTVIYFSHLLPVSVAARSQAWMYGCSLFGNAGSNPFGACMSVYFGCYVLSGRGPCDGPISRTRESYPVWCV